MDYQDVIYIELKDKEKKNLNNAIDLLDGLEKIVANKDGFEYTRDIFHETRCSLIKIGTSHFISDSGTYQITRKPEETNPMANSLEYVKRLARRYLDYEKSMDYAEESTTTLDDVIKDFTKVNTTDNTILYYIEQLLDGVEV